MASRGSAILGPMASRSSAILGPMASRSSASDLGGMTSSMTVDPNSNGRVPADAPTAVPAHAAPPPRALPGSGETRRHVLVAVVLNKPGVLNRVASLMRARNFNIDSLAVSHTDRDDVSRMTITLHGDDVAVEQA